MLKLSKSKRGHYKTAYKKLESIANIPIEHHTIDDFQDIIDTKAPTYYPADGHKLTGYLLLMIYSGMMPGELFKAKKEYDPVGQAADRWVRP
jgi:hypothetical protein